MQSRILSRTAFFRAAVDFAESDPEGLDQLDLDLPTSERILVILLQRGLTPKEILQRVASSEFCEELMRALTRLVPRNTFEGYYQCLMTSGPESIGYEAFMDDSEAFQELKAVVIGAHWERLVTDRLVRHDYRRTWDEIKKACYMAPPPFSAVEQFVGQLHTALCADGRLPEITQDFLEMNSQCTKLAGFRVACSFCTVVQGCNYRFDRTGQMVLAVARHFSAQRSVKRTTRLKRALAEYRSLLV